jgi:hypothetical protein
MPRRGAKGGEEGDDEGKKGSKGRGRGSRGGGVGGKRAPRAPRTRGVFPTTLEDDPVEPPATGTATGTDSGRTTPAESIADPNTEEQVEEPAVETVETGTEDTEDQARPTGAKKKRSKRAVPVTSLEAFRETAVQEAFIEWWKGQSCLYNKKTDAYHRRDHKETLLRLKAADLGVSEDQLAKYMKHMRDAFNKVSKLVEEKTRSGSGQLDLTEFLSQHDQWIYQVMGWIKVHLQHHKGVSAGVS